MSLIENKQTELTAGYLNSIAGTFAGGGVIGPLIATAFGVTGSGRASPDVDTRLRGHDLLCRERRLSCRRPPRPREA